MPTARAGRRPLRAVRRHPGPAAPRRAGQLLGNAAAPDHPAQVRQRQCGPAIGALPGVVITPQADLLPTDDISHLPSSARSRSRSSTNSTARPAGGWSASTRTAWTSTCSTRCRPRRRRRCRSPWTGPSRTPPSTRSTGRAQGDVRRDQAVDGRDPGRRPERGRRRRWTPATMGLYPPGSTFKIITAGAAIDRDMATPNTLLACPGEIEIGQRMIPNYDKFDLGIVPMSRAFANSCNTTFAELASRMPAAGLTMAAAQYGIGPTTRSTDHTRVGFGAADGEPRRAHRGRLRSGQGAGQPVRDGAGGGHRRCGQDPGAATDRGQARPGSTEIARRSAGQCSTACGR